MSTSTSPTERAQQAASTATDESKHVAGVAKEEAMNVASTAADQAKNLVSDTMSQVTGQLGEQATSQRDRAVGTLKSLGEDLERMATESGGSGLAADLAREVAQRARALGSRLEDREPGDLLEDVRDLARRRTGLFLLGSLAAGLVAGRVVRAAADGTAAAAVAHDRQTAIGGTGTGNLGGVAGPGYADDDLTARPTVSSGPGVVEGPTPTTPPMPTVTPGHQTVEAPGDLR